MDGKLNFVYAYTSYKDCFKMFGQLAREMEGVDYTVSLLALEGLYRLEFDCLKKNQFILGGDSVERFKDILQSWRCESPMKDPFTANCVPEILKSLSIFTLLDVPVFTGSFGQKAPMTNGRRDVEEICVDRKSLVIQCCHRKNSFDHNGEGGVASGVQSNVAGVNTNSCVDRRFCHQASFSMKGRWFKLLPKGNYASNDTPNTKDDNEADDNNSCQPSSEARPVTTTLSRLGVTGLCQGEVVYDVNTSKTYVILYATDDSNKKHDFHGLKKPALSALRRTYKSECSIEVVIFIPDSKIEYNDEQKVCKGVHSNHSGAGISHNEQPTNAIVINPGVNLALNVVEGESCPKRANNCINDGSNCDGSAATFSNPTPENESRINITGAGNNGLGVTELGTDLIGAFTSPEGLKLFLTRLTDTLKQVDQTIGLLAIEGLYRLDEVIGLINGPEVNLNRLPTTDFEREDFLILIERIRELMYKWLPDFPSSNDQNQLAVTKTWWQLRQALVVYKTLQVPMFVDNLFKLKVRGLDSYSQDQMEDVDIDGETIIIHVTHVDEARNISRNSLMASDRRNSVKGTWFSIGRKTDSIYGSKSFETKPSLLGITGLQQGEIIYYRAERNVILYATDETGVDFKGLKKPTREFVERESKTLSNDGNRSPRPYVSVSVFIPERLLPSADNFHSVISEGADVKHVGLCIKETRGEIDFCNELVNRMQRVDHSPRFRQPSPGGCNNNLRFNDPSTLTPFHAMNNPSDGDIFYANMGSPFPVQSCIPPLNNRDPRHMSPYNPFPWDLSRYGNAGHRMDVNRYPNDNAGHRMCVNRVSNDDVGYGMSLNGGTLIPPLAPHFDRQPHPHPPHHQHPYFHHPTGQDQRFRYPTFHQRYFN